MIEYKSNIRKLNLFKLFRSMYFSAGIFVPFFLEWGKISYLQIMFLQSWFVIWITLLEVPTGAVADYFGRKTSLFIGMIVNIIAVIVYSSYPNFYLFLLGEFLWALAFALISGADEAIIYDSLKEMKKEKDSKKILGRYNGYELWGITLAAPIGSFIAMKFGLQYALKFMFIPFLLAAIIAYFIKEPKYKEVKESKRYIIVLKEGLKYFYNHKVLKILALDAVSISVLGSFIIWTYQPLLIQNNLPLIYLGWVHGAAAFFEIIISNNFEKFEKIFGSKKNYMFYTSIIIGIGYILLSFSPNFFLTIPLIILVMGFGMTRHILFRNYMNKYIQSKNRATVLSAISMLNSLGRALLYPIIGLLVEFSLNLTVLILGIAVLVVSFFSKVEEDILID